MKALIQKVTKASVSVEDELISSIGKGLCILLGISKYDKLSDAQYLAKKIINLRIFDDDKGKMWDKSVKDKQFEILCVSQFTLCAVLKGNKPDFHRAMAAESSQEIYNQFLNELRKQYSVQCIKDGKFGAYMHVSIENDGPVTLMLESPTVTGDEESSTKKEL